MKEYKLFHFGFAFKKRYVKMTTAHGLVVFSNAAR